jgi:hypothetical protein
MLAPLSCMLRERAAIKLAAAEGAIRPESLR